MVTSAEGRTRETSAGAVGGPNDGQRAARARKEHEDIIGEERTRRRWKALRRALQGRSGRHHVNAHLVHRSHYTIHAQSYLDSIASYATLI